MSIKKCPRCGKIFSPISGSLICGECIKLEEQEFEKVRSYLKINRGADINTVSKETEVSTKKILKYLREGRIEVTEGMSDFLKCEKCGVNIRSGQYCRSCSEKVAKNLQSVLIKKEEPKTEAKMHIRRN